MTKITDNRLDISENDFLSALDDALSLAEAKMIPELREGEFTIRMVSDRKNISLYHAEKLIEQMVIDGLAEKAILVDGDEMSAIRRKPREGGTPTTAYRLKNK